MASDPPQLPFLKKHEYNGFQTIIVKREKNDEVVWITFNRPEKLNAINGDLIQELHDVFNKIETDSKCRVVVLSGI
jgi:enoyl-CoA hydratase